MQPEKGDADMMRAPLLEGKPRLGASPGFTLIELLIVVAILGILAAVVIPNVGRFLGRGQEEARRTEFQNVSAAVTALMTENKLAAIPQPIGTVNLVAGTCASATQAMDAFPDSASAGTDGPDPGTAIDKEKDPNGAVYDYVEVVVADRDKAGYLLYGHDIVASPGAPLDGGARVNYINLKVATYFYVALADGTVYQCDAAAGNIKQT
jgi:type IV pilus assembly protein PilA